MTVKVAKVRSIFADCEAYERAVRRGQLHRLRILNLISPELADEIEREMEQAFLFGTDER